MSDVRYKVLAADGPLHVYQSVTGYQIGRFAVRSTPPNFMVFSTDNQPCVTRAWLVDHIPSGFVILSVDTFEEAVVVADDLSRFSKSDPSAKKPANVLKQIGPDMDAWLRGILLRQRRGLPAIGFREWKAS